MFSIVVTAGGALMLGSADAPPRLKPWSVDLEGENCAATQVLGKGTGISVGRTPGSDLTVVTLRDRHERVKASNVLRKLSLSLEPGRTFAADGYVDSGEKGSTRTIRAEITDQSFLDALSRASSVRIQHPDVRSAQAAITPAAWVTAELRRCEDRKMRRFGIDPTRWRALRARPVLAMMRRELFRPEDYPLDAAFSGISGTVVARLAVGGDGRAHDCVAAQSSGNTKLDLRTCQVLTKRSRFQPALDQSGRPVSAPYIVKIHYCIAGYSPRC